MTTPWDDQLEALGQFIRTQRRLSNLSLRQLANLTGVSNPYLSQIERGLHEPSVHVLRSIARALNVSAETLLEQAGGLDDDLVSPSADAAAYPATETAIRTDPSLTDAQKDALLAVYRSYREQNQAGPPSSAPVAPPASAPAGPRVAPKTATKTTAKSRAASPSEKAAGR